MHDNMCGITYSTTMTCLRHPHSRFNIIIFLLCEDEKISPNINFFFSDFDKFRKSSFEYKKTDNIYPFRFPTLRYINI